MKKTSLNKKITARITEKDHTTFNTLFKHAKLGKTRYTTSDFIRDSIFNNNLDDKINIVQIKTVYRDRFCKDESLRIYHLSKIGNNINQMAHKMNNGDILNQSILFELQEINKVMKALL
mgnify:CR=1 FL=1